MDEKQKAKKIIKILNKIYPTAPVPLKHKNNFTLMSRNVKKRSPGSSI